MELAVIKSFNGSCDAEEHQFGIVFDSEPDKVKYMDLLRPGRNDWKEVEWEDDDIFETEDRRPMCPQCAHPLGVGRAAWTKCTPYG